MLKLLSTIGTVAAVAVPTSVAAMPASAPGYMEIDSTTALGKMQMDLEFKQFNSIGSMLSVETATTSIGDGITMDFSSNNLENINAGLMLKSLNVTIKSLGGPNTVELPRSLDQLEIAKNQLATSIQPTIKDAGKTGYAWQLNKSESYLKNSFNSSEMEINIVGQHYWRTDFGFETQFVKFDGVDNEFEVDVIENIYENAIQSTGQVNTIETKFWVNSDGLIKSTTGGTYSSSAGATFEIQPRS